MFSWIHVLIGDWYLSPSFLEHWLAIILRSTDNYLQSSALSYRREFIWSLELKRQWYLYKQDYIYFYGTMIFDFGSSSKWAVFSRHLLDRPCSHHALKNLISELTELLYSHFTQVQLTLMRPERKQKPASVASDGWDWGGIFSFWSTLKQNILWELYQKSLMEWH